MNFLDLLNQDEVWIDRAGERHRIDSMDRHHRHHVIGFLHRHARQLQWAWYMRPTWMFAPDEVADQVDADFRLPPADWLDRQPLLRALRAADERDRRPLDPVMRKVRTARWKLSAR